MQLQLIQQNKEWYMILATIITTQLKVKQLYLFTFNIMYEGQLLLS